MAFVAGKVTVDYVWAHHIICSLSSRAQSGPSGPRPGYSALQSTDFNESFLVKFSVCDSLEPLRVLFYFDGNFRCAIVKSFLAFAEESPLLALLSECQQARKVYTYGMEQFLFVGLSNPAPEYKGTRHNLGQAALEAWQKNNKELLAANLQLHINCLFPATGMNNSGEAVKKFVSTTQISPDHIVVIHDDVELPLGAVRLTFGGSAQGHNGVRSIQAALNTPEFWRLRLGVGRPPAGVPLNEFVLEKFPPEQREAVERIRDEAARQLSALLTERPAPG